MANQKISAIAKTSGNRCKKLTISRSSMKMSPGDKVKLNIKNANKKVKWSSGNRKIAVIASKSGKYKNKAVIRAKKQGNCTITAKVGKQKRKCKVRIKTTEEYENRHSDNTADVQFEKDNAAGIQFEKVSATDDSIAVTLKMYNYTKQPIVYGMACKIEKQSNGTWTAIETKEPYAIPSIACIIKPNSFHSCTFQVPNLKNPVTNGIYRISLPDLANINPPSLKIISSAIFKITNRPSVAPPVSTDSPVPAPIKTPPASTNNPTTTPIAAKTPPAFTYRPVPTPVATNTPPLSENASVNMSLSEINYTENSISVKMTVQNNSTSVASLSSPFYFEKWENGCWNLLHPIEPIAYTCDMIVLPDYGQKYEEVCSYTTKETVTPGRYRLVRTGIFCDNPNALIENTAEFIIQ